MSTRQNIDADIVCVGFGPAMGGFLTTLSRRLVNEDGTPRLESQVVPGMPLQVLCYERADDVGFGVSGVVSRARAIRHTFPDIEKAAFPTFTSVKKEKLVYLLDPVGASRRGSVLRIADSLIRVFGWLLPFKDQALEIPFTPSFLAKHDGYAFSIGQFNQWVASQLMASGLVQIWPASPVSSPLVEGSRVVGVRLADQGTDKEGNPDTNFMPGMDVKASLTVVGDGPYGPVGSKLSEAFGVPEKFEREDWAVGMKMVVDLPKGCSLEPGTVIHTLGFPEPGIFGFLYVFGGHIASLGIFVPSWFRCPSRNAYRYLQHWMMHPYLWKHLNGGTLRSWGAKSILEAGARGEPHLVGDGFARIGEGSGTTNILTNSGVDEAWLSGVQLGEAVIELAEAKKAFTQANLESTYVRRRRQSWLEGEARIAKRSRDGFQKGFIRGLVGMSLAGFSRGFLFWPGKKSQVSNDMPTAKEYYGTRMSPDKVDAAIQKTRAQSVPSYGSLMTLAGWPEIPHDGKLLVSHQDALLMGGKVQAAAGYSDHVRFRNPQLCETCDRQICIEMCSGQAITPGEKGVPQFDREKCVHCGACLWNCVQAGKLPHTTNVSFEAGAGGLHSAEN